MRQPKLIERHQQPLIQKIDISAVVFGVLLSTALLKEKITWQLVLGGVLVFLSTFLVTTLDERRKAEVPVDAQI
jgi:drug/metabolite transporter (DMT)-like permease